MPRKHTVSPLDLLEYAVVDVETTGLQPQYNNRVIEIAIIRLNSRGEATDEYCTLVNPKRDVGPTHIHGIRNGDVSGAPTFDLVVGDVLNRMAGAVFVAHNVHFDYRFVNSELRAAGVLIPEIPLLCTMQLAKRAIPDLPGRKLCVCCAHLGIRPSQHHSALDDARATALLFQHCLQKRRQEGARLLRDLKISCYPAGRGSWPSKPAAGICCTRPMPEASPLKVDFIGRLVSSLPLVSHTDDRLESYFSLLDKVLEDRHVAEEEAAALAAAARDCSISRRRALEANHRYMRGIINAAMQDNVITEAELADLESVRDLLSIPKAEFQEMLVKANPIVSA